MAAHDAFLAAFYGRLARGLEAGLPIVGILQHERALSSHDRELDRCIVKIERGGTFAEAAREAPRLFPGVNAQLVAAGEEAGTLPSLFHGLARDAEHRLSVRARLVRAMIEPAAVLFVILFILPAVRTYLKISTEEVADRHLPHDAWRVFYLDYAGPPLLALVGVAAVGAAVALLLPALLGKANWSRLLEVTPLAGPLVRGRQYARTAATASFALAAGLPIARVLGIAGQASGSRAVAMRAERVTADVVAGGTLAESSIRRRLFPSEAAMDLEAAERSGTLDRALLQMAENWQADVDRRVALLAKFILVAAIVAVAGLMVFTVFQMLVEGLGSAFRELG